MASTETFPEIPAVVAPPPLPPQKKKRRWSRLQRGFIALLALAVLGMFGAVAYVVWTEGRIDRIPGSELLSLTAAGSDPENFLIVGTDDRTNLPDEWEDKFGSFDGRRADVIMVGHIVAGERIQLLSIPRDLKVSIPEHGTNRVNAAYVFGGPDLLVETVQNETGIPINHYVEIDFGGFGEVVDALGGVTMNFPEAARDGKSGFAVEAGAQTLDGEMAVAYTRSRRYEVYRNGDWNGSGGGDIARTQRQQEILVRLFDQVTSPASAFNLPTFLPVFADQITADEGLSLGLMSELARAALGLRSGDIERATLPVENSKGSDGRAYVIQTSEAPGVIAAFIAGDPYP
jgi:LCP family protein required for cell wall assembly